MQSYLTQYNEAPKYFTNQIQYRTSIYAAHEQITALNKAISKVSDFRLIPIDEIYLLQNQKSNNLINCIHEVRPII